MTLTGKELLFKVLKHEEVSRPAWVPFAGIHAGKLKGYTAKEILQDGDKLFESLMEVNKIYNPDGQPIMFDLQIEAEILGCDLYWAEDTPPSVVSHPLAGTSEIPTKMIEKTDGRIPMVLDVMHQMKEAVGNKTALYGLFCGPFTLASHLKGTEIFMDMLLNPQSVKDLMEYSTKICLQMVEYYIEAGMDVIAPVDPLVSQISPENFRDFCSEPFAKIFELCREKGVFSSFFVCGNAVHNLGEMCLTKPDSVSIDENIPMAKAKAITDQYNVVVGGNIPLTTTMLFGNQQDNMKYTVELIDSVDSTRNLIVAPGCDMPYDVPIENTIAVAQAVLETEKVREVIKNYEASGIDIEVELPDYENLEKPLVEVFTLDSTSCAACTYMWAVALDAQNEFGDKIEVIEIRYNTPENIARIQKMGVAQLPSLYINGELKYSSIIPSQEELFKEVEKCL